MPPGHFSLPHWKQAKKHRHRAFPVPLAALSAEHPLSGTVPWQWPTLLTRASFPCTVPELPTLLRPHTTQLSLLPSQQLGPQKGLHLRVTLGPALWGCGSCPRGPLQLQKKQRHPGLLGHTRRQTGESPLRSVTISTFPSPLPPHPPLSFKLSSHLLMLLGFLSKALPVLPVLPAATAIGCAYSCFSLPSSHYSGSLSRLVPDAFLLLIYLCSLTNMLLVQPS